MLDVAMILMSSHLTGYLRNGVTPKPSGNRNPHATNSCYAAKEGLVMLGASNLRQQRRLWQALERPDIAKRDNEERERDGDREAAILSEILQTRTADEWEVFFQARHVPAARVRSLAEAVHDPQFASRGVTHHHESAPGIEGGFDVPLAAFKFAHGGPSIETPPPELGADTDQVLAEYGYDPDQIVAFRKARVI
jgi:crotonobetainyl-CoA:carnitine CoA-transferase CaiB-like acyl-CoA transferase